MATILQDIQTVRSLRKSVRDPKVPPNILKAIENIHHCIKSGTDLNGWKKVEWRGQANTSRPTTSNTSQASQASQLSQLSQSSQAMQSTQKLNPKQVKEFLKKYNDMINVQFEIKINKKEYCTHFINWLNKQPKPTNGTVHAPLKF